MRRPVTPAHQGRGARGLEERRGEQATRICFTLQINDVVKRCGSERQEGWGVMGRRAVGEGMEGWRRRRRQGNKGWKIGGLREKET